MVQSVELAVKGDATGPVGVRPPTIDGAVYRQLHVYQHGRTMVNPMRTVVEQTAPLGNIAENGVVSGYGEWNRMSRPSSGGKPGGPTPAVPGPVAQQAQQYLEQNIMAWMQPKTGGQQILPSTVSSAGSQMSQRTLHEQPSPASSISNASPSLTSCVPPSSLPHSLSFSGYSHHSLMQGTSFSSPCPSTFGTAVQPPSAAASFFARAAQRLNLSSRRRRRQQHQSQDDQQPPAFLTNFAEVLRVSPPPVPPSLLKSVGSRRDNFCIGKVKVMVRIKGGESDDPPCSPFLSVDARKKQITVYDQLAAPEQSPRGGTGVSAPKMFAFDAIFPADDTQAEVCSSSLPDVIQAVVGGSDGCLFVYGHSKLGKTHTMVGGSGVDELGVLPCAISWLFRLIHEQRQKTGARFSVRVSALELTGRNELLRDLLSEYAAGTEGSGTSPGVYLRDDPIFGAQLINQSELRAPTAEKAAYLLDAALAARTRDSEDEGRNSHFLFTLHLYQYRVERGGKGGVAGGRSRLHLFDLESCDKTSSKPRDGGSLSLSALGNVILAIFNGQKHVPYKESKLTQLLKEAMSSLTCRVAMIAHISSQPSHYSEILGTIQLASRVHRMRRKKIKYPNVPMDSTDEKGVCVRPYVRMHAEDNVKSGNSDPDYTSSSEQSCDTVIYVGHLSHNENFTDNEGPPASLPIVPKLKQSQNKCAHNTDTSTLERKRHNSISRTQNNGDDQRKSEEKSSALTHNSNLDAHHSTSPGKSTKLEKNQPNSKNSPMSSRHQPASTQTLGSENTGHAVKSAQNSPLHTQRKTKHRSSQAKQDQGTGIEQAAKGQSPAKTIKKQSDETWIDGPRFLKPKFDSKTLHQLQKEQWVDGPPNVYGFMDHHKQDMIQRWIEEHSKQLQSATKKKNNEVWIDYPSNTEKDNSTNETHKSADASNGTSTKEKHCAKIKQTNGQEVTGESEIVRTISLAEINSLQRETEIVDDEADSASNSADVDETDNEENAETSGYDADLHILQLAQSNAQSQSLRASLSANTFSASLQEGYAETIEVFEPEEPVPMVDSCLQVTEEDILAEYLMQRRHKSSENPLPEVDQSSCDSKSHPLRILSQEYLNLPSSFADSRSVSIDLDSISVPDMREGFGDRGAVTWSLLYGNMFQRIKEQQKQKQRRTIDDIDVTNSDVNNKLERIAKLRELIRPLTKHRSQTKVESIFKTCSINRLSSSGSRYTMPEILDGSTDSSMEDLSAAEVTSTQSEPADLDFDKLDYKLNIKPMNGLKLEEFYKKIQKVPPFLEQYSSMKPTQIVSPLTYEQEKIYLNKLESQRSDSTTFINSIDQKQFSNTSNFKSSIDGTSNGKDVKHQSTCSLQQTSSTSYTHKPSSTSNLQRESAKFSASENTIPTRVQKNSTDHTELERRTSEKRDSKKSLDSNDTKRSESKSNSRNTSNKNIDTTMLTVGQSPSSNSKSRLHRGKIKNGENQSIHSQQPLTQSSSSSLWSKDSSTSSSTTKPPHRSGFHPNGSSRGPNSKCHLGNCNSPVNNGKTSRTVNNNNTSCKLPTRSSPTSSSTSGVTTMCCSSKPKDKTTSSKSKPLQSHSKQKQSTKSQRSNKSICRSTSSPSTCVDSGDTVITDFTDSEHYHAVRHASVSGVLASPYHKVPHVHVSRHHQRTSSGHGSESSATSEAKELLAKGAGCKTQQFSGTSSGYESMLRDSEGTPLSSSQESGNEESERGRRGRRRSNGSSKRSSSAPARSPPSPLGPSAAIHQQPMPNRSNRRTDRSLHRSDEEVCCTSLLCCRLLDFY